MDYFRTSVLLLLLWLLSLLPGFITDTIDQSCSCENDGNCDFTNQCIPKGNCSKDGHVILYITLSWILVWLATGHKQLQSRTINGAKTVQVNTIAFIQTKGYMSENVALGKAANISSVYDTVGTRSGPACLAVNGNTDTSIVYASNNDKPNCVKSSVPEYFPSWTVDLGKNYTITNITLYNEKSYPVVTGGLQITVDGKLCYQYNNTALGEEREEIQCTKPVTGRNVKFNSTRNFYIFFCEVQVWVCKAGLYGNDCDQVCHCKDNDTCDNYYGTCTTACSNGYYGHNCSFLCKNCPQGQCDKINGSCLNEYEAGWINTTREEVCNNGTYGQNCSGLCGYCVNGEPCDKVNGYCLSCEPGMKLPFCQKACDNGTYGPNCSSTCGSCTNDEPCDKVNGTCVSCKPGWVSTLCQEACNNGTYGQNCFSVCGNCANGESCDKVNGHCLSCEPGLKMPHCQQACNNGTYGQNCYGACGDCTNREPCDKVIGACLSCEPGLIMPLCQQTCNNGTYGQDCYSACGNCKNGEPCDKVNGACLSCEPGLIMPLCQQGSTTSEGSGNIVGPIVGAIVGGFIILSITVSVTIVIHLRRQKSRSADSLNTPSDVIQTASDTRGSIQPSKKDESAIEYDEIGNHYDSLHPVNDSENHNYASHATEERKFKSSEDKHVYLNEIAKNKF